MMAKIEHAYTKGKSADLAPQLVLERNHYQSLKSTICTFGDIKEVRSLGRVRNIIFVRNNTGCSIFNTASGLQ